MKELDIEKQQENQIERVEKDFSDSPLGKAIHELEGHIENHLLIMLDSFGVKVTDEQKPIMMSNFIAATHASGTIQRLVWEQMDYEAKQRAAIETSKAEKLIKKNKPSKKTSNKKA